MARSPSELLAEYHNFRFSNTTGSTSQEIDACISLSVFYNVLTVCFVNMFFQTNKSNSFRIFIFEFVGCVSSLVITLTYLSEYIFFISGFTALVIIAVCLRLNGGIQWQLHTDKIRVKDNRLSCVSHFRGMVNLYSVICILAADFSFFPKRFLKTEFYGFGLMDTGVGLFAVTLALGSSHSRSRPARPSDFLKHSILLLLGIGRYLSVRSVDYHHQIFEYGVHWNFFITLAVIGIFNEFLFRLINSTKSISFFSIILLISYEFALNAGVRDWIFGSSPRDSFISANREGICSVIGYEVLYLWGVIIKSILPRKGDSYEQYLKAVKIYLKGYLILLVVNYFSYSYFPPSRRCANFAYVRWITAISLFYLIIILTFELIVNAWNMKMKTKISSVPLIIESVNFNGLLFFLLGNLLTGIINLKIPTLLLDDFWSFVILIMYSFTCCSVSSILYTKKWRIR